MAYQDAPWQGPAGLLPPVFDAFCDFEGLPRECTVWPLSEPHSGSGTQACLRDVRHSLRTAAAYGHWHWHWPERPVVFVSDPHADAEGFLRSLVAAGTIRRSGTGPRDFALTAFGQHARIVVGGDCLDKGPSNLDMLDALAALFSSGADVHLLAGNHDLRFMLAVQVLTGPRCPLTEHLFVRMGRKIVPLLREVWDRFPAIDLMAQLPDETGCRARIFPGPEWEAQFPARAGAHLSQGRRANCRTNVVAVEARNRRGLIGVDRLLGFQVAEPVDGVAIREKAAHRVLGPGVGVEIAHEDFRLAVFDLGIEPAMPMLDREVQKTRSGTGCRMQTTLARENQSDHKELA